LLIDPSRISELLRRLDRWLIIEVQIKRYLDSSAHRSYNVGRESEQLPYLPPYTKYFLIDFAGELHDR
jgi:hypothetical protein